MTNSFAHLKCSKCNKKSYIEVCTRCLQPEVDLMHGHKTEIIKLMESDKANFKSDVRCIYY